jgi:MFS family permease
MVWTEDSAVDGSGDKARVGGAIVAAWLTASIFYFTQYVMRSAPAVMMPELTDALGLTAAAVAGMLGLFYYGYAPFSLVAGVALDQLGAKRVVPMGAAVMAIGAGLFATGDPTLASVGRFLQGAGGVFALIGAVYLATTHFPVSKAATLIGVTQMFGMAGGSAGQFVVGPAIERGLGWSQFWIAIAVAAVVITAALALLMPRSKPKAEARGPSWMVKAERAIIAVFRNPQSILCGLISGLMFLPTTIFDMVWGVRFLQESHDLPFSMAVMRSASVPFGWIIGCPLLGVVSDRLGRRKPVIAVSAAVLLVTLALILYGPSGVYPPFSLGLIAGVASGAAMLPYTVIKEANRPEHSGTATGVINFVNFSLSALLGPVFGNLLTRYSAGGERELVHYQQAFSPLIWGVGLAIALTLILKETGSARAAAVHRAEIRPA